MCEEISVVSYGYGKKNVNELTALAKGSFLASPGSELILDIGEQDTKVIRQILVQAGALLAEF